MRQTSDFDNAFVIRYQHSKWLMKLWSFESLKLFHSSMSYFMQHLDATFTIFAMLHIDLGIIIEFQLGENVTYYLPKFTIFGKYVRLSVCYLPKFTIFGKYVRLSVCYLPKFSIFASMFVCRFVCLSVCFVKHNSWTLRHNITKLGPHMEWVSSSSMWHWQISRSWNEVTRSKNRPNFKIATTPSILELQVRSIAQNVGSAIGLSVDITYFRWQFWRKSSPRPQKFYLFNTAPIRYQKWKDHVQIMREKLFFMMMTSLMTSQRDDKVSLLYPCLTEISAFSCIIHKRFDKSSSTWIHICTGSLVPASYLDN